MKRIYGSGDGGGRPFQALWYIGLLGILIVIVADFVGDRDWSISGLFFLRVALAASTPSFGFSSLARLTKSGTAETICW